jgi:predicted RNA-binding Zn-ribbon protein involved in translation (DUF1610 family)
MSGSSQFYADNEKNAEAPVENLDLSLAYEVKPKIFSDEEWEDSGVGFFCHECNKLVAATKKEGKVSFTCNECGKNEISFGTVRSLINHFRLNDNGVRKE